MTATGSETLEDLGPPRQVKDLPRISMAEPWREDFVLDTRGHHADPGRRMYCNTRSFRQKKAASEAARVSETRA